MEGGLNLAAASKEYRNKNINLTQYLIIVTMINNNSNINYEYN